MLQENVLLPQRKEQTQGKKQTWPARLDYS